MKPTVQQIAGALGLVRYEMEQLLECHRFKPADRIEENMCLESFLIHYRALLDFFTHGGDRKDNDILAAHFGYRGQVPVTHTEERKRLNKDLAHLTYSRLTRKNKRWDLQKLMMAVKPHCAEFAHRVVNNPPAMATSDELARWRKLLAKLEEGDAAVPCPAETLTGTAAPGGPTPPILRITDI